MMLHQACDPLQHTSMYQRAEEDSEDSDGEGGLGNVSRVIIRPPGHSGKAKRGHLCFDAAFETGNLGRADLHGEFEYDLFLRPDTCNPRYRFWFNFTVDNVKQDQRVIFNIINISKSRNLFKDGLTPIVKSSGRPKWQRIPLNHVFYYRSPIHQNHYVLSFAFAFDKEDEVYQFAIAPPYSYSRLQSYLGVLDTKFPGKFERTVIGKSLQNRKLDLLTFDHVIKNKPLQSASSVQPIMLSQKLDNKNFLRVIVLLARAHPGESPSSYVCQGFLEFMCSVHPIANCLRENFIFKIIPMLNPDGVFLGNNRCNLIGQDLNRSWNIATEFSHPTILATKNMLKEIDNSDSCQIDFVLDIHAHSSLIGSFIYGNTYDDVYRYERHLVFPKLLATNCDDFEQTNMMFNADDRKTGSARRFCCERLSDTANAYTLEISMCGYYVKGTRILTQYTDEGYMRFGRNIARTLFEYYRFTNILTIPMLSELLPSLRSKGRPKTHKPRGRSRIRPDIQPRPKTTRTYAPISYTDLSIRYDSSTSNEGSPSRFTSSYYYGNNINNNNTNLQNAQAIINAFGTRSTGNIYMMNQDQFSLLAIQSSKFTNLDFSNEYKFKQLPKLKPLTVIQQQQQQQQQQHHQLNDNKMYSGGGGGGGVGTAYIKTETLNIPPKPYLSIIDFNQLTRGGLELATRKNCEINRKK